MTRLTPENIEGTIVDNKIIKKLNDGSFAEADASDITALGFVAGGLNINHISTYTDLNSSQVPNGTNTSSVYNPSTNQFIMTSMNINCNSAGGVTRTRLQKSNDGTSGWTDVYMIEIIESVSGPGSRSLEMGFMLSKDLYYRSQSEQIFTGGATFTVLTATEL